MTDITEIIDTIDAKFRLGDDFADYAAVLRSEWGQLLAAYREQAAELTKADEMLKAVAAQCEAAEREVIELREKLRKLEEQEPVAWITEDGERAVTDKTYRVALRDGGASKSAMAPFCVPAYRLPKPAPVSVPEGMVLVPQEPTDEMINAAWGARSPDLAYRAMLSAAPQPKESSHD